MKEALEHTEDVVITDLNTTKVLQPCVDTLDFPAPSITAQLAFILERAANPAAAIRYDQFRSPAQQASPQGVGIITAGQTIGISNLGWYAFRHTYRTLLDDLGTPIGVQQKLMRHSDVRTTMNLYGSAYEKTKRRANTLVAGKLLPETMKAASRTTIQ